MSIPAHVTRYLDSQGAQYEHLTHSLAYTAQETAHAQHVSGKVLAKTVMVIADGNLVMTVMPASARLDLEKLAHLMCVSSIRLAAEQEFARVFPNCEVGAMPPFGNLYHLDVWVDEGLRNKPMVVFNAGTHIDTIQMSFAEFERLVQPQAGRIAEV